MTVEPALDEKVDDVHGRLDALGIAHAFGGALALAYYAEPRATVDIDLNVFVPPARADRVLEALAELGVDGDREGAVRRAREEGQVRVAWGRTPLDLFFAYDPFHEAAATRVRTVPFGETTIPILGPEDLAVCKAVFDRRKDWIDIEQVLLATAGELDIDEVRGWMSRIVGPGDPRCRRLDAAIAQILG